MVERGRLRWRFESSPKRNFWRVLLGWLVTGLENQGAVTGRGSTPLLSAMEGKTGVDLYRTANPSALNRVWFNSTAFRQIYEYVGLIGRRQSGVSQS